MKNLLHLIGGVLLIGAALLVYGFFIEPEMLKVRKVSFVSEEWRGPPLMIGLVSDFHIGGLHVNDKRVAHVVKKLNSLSPDITLVAGDFVNGHHPYEDWEEDKRARLNKGFAALGKLHAPLGVYAVPGNHDGYYGRQHVEAELTRAGLTVLENRAATIRGQGQYPGFCLIGLADYMTGQKDITVAQHCEPGKNIIAFMHSPDSFLYLPHTTTLALAGHTHGGQIYLPFSERTGPLLALGNEYVYGKVKYHNIPAFVTAGIGTSIIPARFRAPPEIVLVTLKAPS